MAATALVQAKDGRPQVAVQGDSAMNRMVQVDFCSARDFPGPVEQPALVGFTCPGIFTSSSFLL